MNGRAMLAIIRKDLKVVSQNKGVILPIIIVTLVLFGVFPWIVALVPEIQKFTGFSVSDMDGILRLINRVPAFQQQFAGYDQNQLIVVYFLVYLLAPFFLIIPIMVSSTIAADSFAGEKERKTMEALLYTPTTDRELFVAKLLGAWLASIAVALLGFGLYTVMANAAAWSQMHRIFFPNAMWLVMIAWVVPAAAGMGLSVMVLVSVKAQGTQDANQIGGMVVLPVIVLFYMQVSGAMHFSVLLVFLLGLVFWLLDGLLIWLGSRSFRRGRLLGA